MGFEVEKHGQPLIEMLDSSIPGILFPKKLNKSIFYGQYAIKLEVTRPGCITIIGINRKNNSRMTFKCAMQNTYPISDLYFLPYRKYL